VKDYISVREAANKWGVSERRVNQYCQQGRVLGLTKFGRSWAIPKDAVKPSDPRCKKVKI
jgi:excisionase family DNA binding protein